MLGFVHFFVSRIIFFYSFGYVLFLRFYFFLFSCLELLQEPDLVGCTNEHQEHISISVGVTIVCGCGFWTERNADFICIRVTFFSSSLLSNIHVFESKRIKSNRMKRKKLTNSIGSIRMDERQRTYMILSFNNKRSGCLIFLSETEAFQNISYWFRNCIDIL